MESYPSTPYYPALFSAPRKRKTTPFPLHRRGFVQALLQAMREEQLSSLKAIEDGVQQVPPASSSSSSHSSPLVPPISPPEICLIFTSGMQVCTREIDHDLDDGYSR